MEGKDTSVKYHRLHSTEPRRGKLETKDGRNRARTTREETEDSPGDFVPASSPYPDSHGVIRGLEVWQNKFFLCLEEYLVKCPAGHTVRIFLFGTRIMLISFLLKKALRPGSC